MIVLSTSGTSDDDLEFYVRKCGEILGVTGKLDKDQRDAKHILEHIFFQVVAFKKLNQVSSSIHTPGKMNPYEIVQCQDTDPMCSLSQEHENTEAPFSTF